MHKTQVKNWSYVKFSKHGKLKINITQNESKYKHYIYNLKTNKIRLNDKQIILEKHTIGDFHIT